MPKSSLSNLLASVAPSAPVSKDAKESSIPTIKVANAAGLGVNLANRLKMAGVTSRDLPTTATLHKETTAMLVGDARKALADLAAAALAASKSLTAEDVTIKPKGNAGRVVAVVSLGDVPGLWAQAAISRTYDGPVGDAMRDLFPRV